VLLKQSAREAKVVTEERRRKEELDKLLLQQGIAVEREHLYRQAEWKRIAEEQATLYIDLVNSNEE
jgi:hypothetical protein